MNDALNAITERVIGAAIEVHRELGPGLLESTYEAALVYELVLQGLRVERQKEQPVRYKGLMIETGYRIDVLVEDQVVVELKAVDAIVPIYQAQLLTYLKLSSCRVGLLINFNVPLLKQGIKRFVL
ncbi:GxxExxY protein [Opitutales bacterium ASA1]|uniref:GxxExxY protein n=1 Tax=Congregicoccus parvus TaxID=3081749 RepID=UPI002B2F7B13|nr:GxxExxY protein [Opitutales bacterium ASA1]